MKAVIVEIRGSYAAALSNDGRVRRVKNLHYSVGQTIQLNQKSKRNAVIQTIVSAAAIIAILSASVYAYFDPYYQVSLDVNPSLAYCVNRFNYVLAYSVLNDGLDILDKLNINHTNINNAVEKTILLLLEAGYLKDNQPAGMVITAAGKADEKAGVLTESLKETIKETTDANQLDVELVAACVTQEYVGQAEEAGVSPGKMLLIDELLKTSARATAQDPKRWYGESVQEIMQRIKENKKSKENEDGKQTESNENVSDDVINNSGSVNTASNEESRRNNNQNNGRGNAGANANANAGKKVNNNANPNANKNANSNANSNSNLKANANANKNSGSGKTLPDTQDDADKIEPAGLADEGNAIGTNTSATDEVGDVTKDKHKDKSSNKDNKDGKDAKESKDSKDTQESKDAKDANKEKDGSKEKDNKKEQKSNESQPAAVYV